MSSEDKTTIEDETILENKDDDKTKIENKEQQVYQAPTENLNITTFRKHKIIEDLPAKGGESDNYIIEYEGKKAFLKLYRKGRTPNVDLDKIKKLFEEDKDHFVEIYESGFDNKSGRYYEIMEYIQYGDLKNLINELSSKVIKQKENTIDKVISEIAEALKVLHNNNIIHRDLKPSNVLVKDKDKINLVLIDFGIAKELEQDISKSGTTSFKGTMQYIAPEEISDYFGKEIDWWHLGIIAYELINGSNPFKGLTDNVIVHTLATKGVEIPKDIPEKYQILLKGLLTRDYKKRWGYEEVKRWLSGDTNINLYYEETEKSDDELEKEWQKYNIPPNSNWRKLGLSPSETKSFIDAGFGYNDARRWVQVGWTSGDLAKKWYESGFEPEEALIFEDLGFSIGQANSVKSKGFSAFDMMPLKDYAIENPVIIYEVYGFIQVYRFIESYNKSKNDKNIINRLFKEAKNWKESFFSLEEAYRWLLNGFTLNEAKNWKKLGFSIDKAKEWQNVGFDPLEASKWKSAGFNPTTAREWLYEGFNVENAVKWQQKGVSPKNAKMWIKEGFDFEVAIKWERAKIGPEYVKDWIEKGFSVEEAEEWTSNGFQDPKLAKVWKEALFRPLEAKEWAFKGFSFYEALKWEKNGFNASQAYEWSSALKSYFFGNKFNGSKRQIDKIIKFTKKIIKAGYQNPKEFIRTQESRIANSKKNIINLVKKFLLRVILFAGVLFGLLVSIDVFNLLVSTGVFGGVSLTSRIITVLVSISIVEIFLLLIFLVFWLIIIRPVLMLLIEYLYLIGFGKLVKKFIKNTVIKAHKQT